MTAERSKESIYELNCAIINDKVSKKSAIIILHVQKIAVGVLDSEWQADLCKHHFLRM